MQDKAHISKKLTNKAKNSTLFGGNKTVALQELSVLTKDDPTIHLFKLFR